MRVGSAVYTHMRPLPFQRAVPKTFRTAAARAGRVERGSPGAGSPGARQAEDDERRSAARYGQGSPVVSVVVTVVVP